MNTTRRTALLGPILILAGCTGITGTVDVSTAITDAGIVVNGVAGVYQSILTLYPGRVSAAQQASVAGYLDAARNGLAQLSSSATTLTGLQGVEDAVNAVLPIIAAIPGLPPEVTAGVLAAQVLLPIIEGVVAQLRGQPPKVAAARAGMSPERARETLRKAAGQK